MELLSTVVKAMVMLPVWAVLGAPFVLVSARLVISTQLTFRAAFMLGVISGGALIVAHVLVWPVYSSLGPIRESALTAVLALLLTSGTYGYFLSDAQGRSIGCLKGGLIALLCAALVFVLMLAIALLAVVAGHLFQA
jgi:hypothetical protein